MNSKRENFISSAIELSINSGKVNENAKYIVYSEASKDEKKEKIEETKKDLKRIIQNVKGIAESLDISFIEILDIEK